MPCGNSQTIRQISQALRDPQNRREGIVVSKDDLLPYWLEMKVENNKLTRDEADLIWERINNGSWPSNPESRRNIESLMTTMLGNASPAVDSVKAAKLARDFRGFGEFREQVYQGRSYIIFKGNPRLRRVFKGTRYSAINPQITSFGIGRLGVSNVLKKGGILTITLLVPYRILQYIYDDEKTFVWLAGNIGSDLIKASISGLIAGVLAVGVVKVSASIVGPLAVVAVAGFGTGLALDRVDSHVQLTGRIVDEMEAALSQAAENIAATLMRLEQAPCRIQRGSRRAANEAIDSLAQMIWDYSKRTGKEFINELVRERLYSGWFYQVAR